MHILLYAVSSFSPLQARTDFKLGVLFQETKPQDEAQHVHPIRDTSALSTVFSLLGPEVPQRSRSNTCVFCRTIRAIYPEFHVLHYAIQRCISCECKFLTSTYYGVVTDMIMPQYLISDAVVVWRACVICKDDYRKTLLIPKFFFALTIRESLSR